MQPTNGRESPLEWLDRLARLVQIQECGSKIEQEDVLQTHIRLVDAYRSQCGFQPLDMLARMQA